MSKNYSIITDPQLNDFALIWDASNSDWRRVTFNDILTLFNTTNATSSTNVLEAVSQYSAPLTGTSVAVNNNSADTHLIITPAGTLAALTITLPAVANLRDKQTLIVNSTQVITALTIAANGATAVLGAPTTLAANGYFTLKYDLTLTTWYRVG